MGWSVNSDICALMYTLQQCGPDVIVIDGNESRIREEKRWNMIENENIP